MGGKQYRSRTGGQIGRGQINSRGIRRASALEATGKGKIGPRGYPAAKQDGGANRKGNRWSPETPGVALLEKDENSTSRKPR